MCNTRHVQNTWARKPTNNTPMTDAGGTVARYINAVGRVTGAFIRAQNWTR